MLIQSDVQDGILTLVLNDPRRRNAMGDGMRQELQSALTAAAANAGVRALILRGAEGTFCAGGDLTAMPPADPDTAARRLHQVGDLIRLLVRFPKPTVARVEGAAAGLGAGLALACDYVYLADNARFLFPFARLGLLPDGGTLHTVAARAGTARARQLLLEAATLDAGQSLEAGLADAVHPTAELAEAVLAMARRAAASAPLPVAAVKAAYGNGLPSLDEALAAEATHQPVFFFSNDFREGKAAHTHRRSPVFTGN